MKILEVDFSAIMKASSWSNETMSLSLSNFTKPIKLSEVAIVKQGWANYIIPSIMVSGFFFIILKYFQKIKPEKTVKVYDKNDGKRVYEVSIGTLKEAPMEKEVMDVLIKEKTYVVPIEDFQMEKFPLNSDVKFVLKPSKKIKQSEGKVFVIRKTDLTEVNETSVNGSIEDECVDFNKYLNMS